MVHRDDKRYKLRILVVTVSTSRTLETDISGRSLKEKFARHKYEVSRMICKDDEDEILNSYFSNKDYDVYVFVGGTGPGRLDVTTESLKRIAQKEITGFGELFRLKSSDQLAFISNASLFTRGMKQIYCIPGSPDATELAFSIISSLMNHLHHELVKE